MFKKSWKLGVNFSFSFSNVREMLLFTSLNMKNKQLKKYSCFETERKRLLILSKVNSEVLHVQTMTASILVNIVTLAFNYANHFHLEC